MDSVINKYRNLSPEARAALVMVLFSFAISLRFQALLGIDSRIHLLVAGFLTFLVSSFLLISPVVGVAVVAWYRGCRLSPVLVVLFLIFVFLTPETYGSYQDFHTAIDFFPAYLSVFTIGAEWAVRERDAVINFLRTRAGVVSVLLGVVNVVAGYVVQIRARDYLFEWVPLLGMYEDTFLTFMNTFGLSLALASLLVVVVLPAFLWHARRLVTPVAVVISWVTTGVWMNYIWWNAHPVSQIHGLGAIPFFPAPDYAVNTVTPLLLILLVAILELAYRGTGTETPAAGGEATRTETGA